jgi:hypothetical protein
VLRFVQQLLSTLDDADEQRSGVDTERWRFPKLKIDTSDVIRSMEDAEVLLLDVVVVVDDDDEDDVNVDEVDIVVDGDDDDVDGVVVVVLLLIDELLLLLLLQLISNGAIVRFAVVECIGELLELARLKSFDKKSNDKQLSVVISVL